MLKLIDFRNIRKTEISDTHGGEDIVCTLMNCGSDCHLQDYMVSQHRMDRYQHFENCVSCVY